MKFNTKTRYAIRAMAEIAKADQKTGILQKDISEAQKISNRYLDHIIQPLKTAKLIVNVKGKKSGYRLARKAEEINMFHIYTAFESEMAVIDCLSEFVECDFKKNCYSYPFWEGLNLVMYNYFNSVSLDDLVKRQLKE